MKREGEIASSRIAASRVLLSFSTADFVVVAAVDVVAAVVAKVVEVAASANSDCYYCC